MVDVSVPRRAVASRIVRQKLFGAAFGLMPSVANRAEGGAHLCMPVCRRAAPEAHYRRKISA